MYVSKQQVKNLFTEDQKKAYIEWSAQNDGSSFDELCENISDACEDNFGNEEDAQAMIDDCLKQLNVEY